ncbi:zinc finger protein 271-like [Culicoides brevitarsis]|uniref:zinc finger protein 271-like n=1 Tax=Culicoides brevitarsis TaxID=469753 RepID=UPI00307C1F90
MATNHLFNCRFCLCETVEPRNMALDTDFLQKALHIFAELELSISMQNGLSVFVCEFCYKFLNQFHDYYETVKENQEFLINEVAPKTIKIAETDENEEFIDEIVSYESYPLLVETVDVIPEEETYITESLEDATRQEEFIIDTEIIQRYKSGEIFDPEVNEQLSQFFICDICDKYFVSKAQITGHMFKHLPFPQPKTNTGDRPSYRRVPKPHELVISCPVCPSTAIKFKNNDILQLHLMEHDRFERLNQSRIERGLEALIECPHCERRFSVQDEFLAHLKNHEANRFMTCELCGRLIVSSSLKTHLKLHFKRYCCEFCSHKFRNRCDLVKHIQLNHERPQSYECQHCFKQIRHKTAMEKHLNFCKGPKSVGPCKHCGETFQSKSDRMYHVQKYHLGYVCKTCDMRLESVTALKNHRKSEEHRKMSYEAKIRRENLKQLQMTTKKTPLRKVIIAVND